MPIAHSCVPREGSPNLMQPMMIRETFNPDLLGRLYSMSSSLSVLQDSYPIKARSRPLMKNLTRVIWCERDFVSLTRIVEACGYRVIERLWKMIG
jgi:hypothetical protein